MAGGEGVIIIVAIAVYLIVAQLVVNDAERRDHNEWFWGFFVLITGLLGGFIYLLVRNPLEPTAD